MIDLGVEDNIKFLLSLINMELTTKYATNTQFVLVVLDGSSSQAIWHIMFVVFTLPLNLWYILCSLMIIS